MSASALLAELGTVFGHEFIESVMSSADLKDMDEAMVPMSKGQMAREKKRGSAMKKAMAAIERGFGRYEKKRGQAAMRKMKADVAKEVKKHDKSPGDAVAKALADLRDMRAKKSDDKSKDKDKDGAKKAPKLKPAKRQGGGGGGGGAQGSSAAGGGGAGGQERGKQKGAAGAGAKGQHNPFKNSPNLGKGPGTPPGFTRKRGSVHHNQKKCWDCDCGPVYTKGCLCRGTGKSKDCPEGRVKRVKIRKDYRDAYNKMYHAWRAKKGGAVTARLQGGGRPGGF